MHILINHTLTTEQIKIFIQFNYTKFKINITFKNYFRTGKVMAIITLEIHSFPFYEMRINLFGKSLSLFFKIKNLVKKNKPLTRYIIFQLRENEREI